MAAVRGIGACALFVAAELLRLAASAARRRAEAMTCEDQRRLRRGSAR